MEATMVAMKKAGLIMDYKAFEATPKSSDQSNIILMITYKNMAALDKGVELENVAKKVIDSTEVQNKASVARNQYRKLLGTELIRELILRSDAGRRAGALHMLKPGEEVLVALPRRTPGLARRAGSTGVEGLALRCE